MKSLISYYFCDKYGENQQEYLNISNFTVTRKNAKDINRLIASLNHAISLPSNYKYITHHATKYHNVPLWVAVNAITFGQVSKLYQYVSGKHDLFSVVIALRYLLDASDFKCFKAELRKCIKTVLKDCPHLTEQQIYAQMGFPANWEKITRYKK
jgi:abortive infection bacteriophage resistance protein